MSAYLYLEGGGDSKELHTRCRAGFRKLLEHCQFAGRMPRLVACGPRESTYGAFKIAHANRQPHEFVAMILDSEEVVSDFEATWSHLADHDRWQKPSGAHDEQVFLMITCMETWIVSDQQTLSRHYGERLRSSALPPLVDLESRSRYEVLESLVRATENCSNAYQKGKRSYELLGMLVPTTMSRHLPSFARLQRVLAQRL